MAPDVMREMGELIMAEWRGMAPIDKLAWCASEVPPSTEFGTPHPQPQTTSPHDPLPQTTHTYNLLFEPPPFSSSLLLSVQVLEGPGA